MRTLLFYSVAIAVAAAMVPSVAVAQSTSSGTMTSNGASTGVGNAGSFGIGSGTSDSDSVATAISNGVQDSHTDNSSHDGMTITTLSTQDLQASNVGNSATYNAGADPSSSPLPTGSNSVGGTSFSNFSGILTNGWNAGPSASAQAGTNIAVNGNFGRN